MSISWIRPSPLMVGDPRSDCAASTTIQNKDKQSMFIPLELNNIKGKQKYSVDSQNGSLFHNFIRTPQSTTPHNNDPPPPHPSISEQMQKSDSKNIRQLLSDPDLTIEDLLNREDFASDVRNISSQFTSILNYQNIRKVIDWLVVRGKEGDSRAYRYPIVAADLMGMETPNINEYLFAPEEEREPLFEYLFRFTEGEDDYTLVGYFSKVMIAIIKRHFSFESRYNQPLCEYLFEKGYLLKLIPHLYSTSTIDLIIRALTLKSKGSDYYQNKKEFIVKILQMMDKSQLSDEITENVFFLIEAILSNETNANTNPTSYKSNIQVSNNYEIRLIAYQEDILNILFKSVGETDRVRKTKARIINLYLNKYRSNEFYLKYQDLISEYLTEAIKYLESKTSNKEGISLGEVFITDNLEAVLFYPIQPYTQLITHNLNVLLSLILYSNWNNIFHQQVERVLHLILSKPFIPKLINSTIASLIEFQVNNRNSQSFKHHYTEFVHKIGAEIVQVGNRSIDGLNEQSREFLREVEEILEGEKTFLVGNSYANPQALGFVYSKENAVKQYLKFLTSQTVIVYQEKEEKKEKEKVVEPVKQQQVSNEQLPQSQPQPQPQPQEQYFFVQPQSIIPTHFDDPQHQSASQTLSLPKHRIHFDLTDLLLDLDI